MRQAHHEEVDFAFNAANRAQGLAKIDLRMIWVM
jgi:hypothetical protein